MKAKTRWDEFPTNPAPVEPFSTVDLEMLCRDWQARLRLQDWDIKIQFVRQFDFRRDAKASCEAMPGKKAALISVLDPVDYPPNILWPQDIEKSIVHELLHVHMSPLEGKFDDALSLFEEQVIECISDALIELKRAGPVVPGSGIARK